MLLYHNFFKNAIAFFNIFIKKFKKISIPKPCHNRIITSEDGLPLQGAIHFDILREKQTCTVNWRKTESKKKIVNPAITCIKIASSGKKVVAPTATKARIKRYVVRCCSFPHASTKASITKIIRTSARSIGIISTPNQIVIVCALRTSHSFALYHLFAQKSIPFFVFLAEKSVFFHKNPMKTRTNPPKHPLMPKKPSHFWKTKIFYLALGIYTCLLQNNMIKW